ncbi:MAG: tellurite resistance methyltransferase TehB [Psittacicella sp.]
MNKLYTFKTSQIFNKDNFPLENLNLKSLRENYWIKINLKKGFINLITLDENLNTILKQSFVINSDIDYLEPNKKYTLELSNDCELSYELLSTSQYYAKNKYITPGVAHSTLCKYEDLFQENNKVLDLGCGSGRNSLYLNLLGCRVSAYDFNINSLSQLNEIVSKNSLQGINIKHYDINTADIESVYDHIVSTVVLMFLNPARIKDIILNMQTHTKLQGTNIIVCAMDSKEYPKPEWFSFGFKAGELQEYYKDWEIILYDESLGKLHRKDIFGNRIELKFVTLIARKPK